MSELIKAPQILVLFWSLCQHGKMDLVSLVIVTVMYLTNGF